MVVNVSYYLLPRKNINKIRGYDNEILLLQTLKISSL